MPGAVPAYILAHVVAWCLTEQWGLHVTMVLTSYKRALQKSVTNLTLHNFKDKMLHLKFYNFVTKNHSKICIGDVIRDKVSGCFSISSQRYMGCCRYLILLQITFEEWRWSTVTKMVLHSIGC